MKKYFLSFLVISMFMACQKEIQFDPLDPVNPVDSCRLRTSYYFGGGGVYDSANYIYENGKLVRLNGSEAIVKYFYDGSFIRSMEYVSAYTNELYRIDTFDFINGLLAGIRSHEFDPFWNDSIFSVLSFEYNGNKISRVTRIDSLINMAGYNDTLYSDFVYTGENITAMYMSDNVGVFDSVLYTYNNDLNYFNPISRYFYLSDPFFQIHVGFEPHIPYFLSRNNVVNFTIYDGEDYPVSYELDSMNRPLMVRQGGFDYMGYKYECP